MSKLSEEKKNEFGAVVLLEKMTKEGYKPPIVLEGFDAHMENLLEWMLTKGYAEATAEGYTVAAGGKKLLDLYQKRFTEFLNVFDIFCAVDLAAGEFAFEKYLDMDDGDWRHYLELDRWDDLRLAVAERKGIDPLDIVFLDFVRGGKFDTEEDGWQFELALGDVWDEVARIIDDAISVEDLGYEADGEQVPGEAVIADVIAQGIDMNIQLKEREREMVRRGEIRAPQSSVSASDLEAQRDPNYRSHIWN